MFRLNTPEEEELYKKLKDKNISKEERKKIIERLKEIAKIEDGSFYNENDYCDPDEFL